MSISFVKVFKEEQLLQNARHDVTERKKSIKLLLFPCHLILLVDTSIQTENNEIFKDFTGYFVAKPLFLDPWISFLRETPFFIFTNDIIVSLFYIFFGKVLHIIPFVSLYEMESITFFYWLLKKYMIIVFQKKNLFLELQ